MLMQVLLSFGADPRIYADDGLTPEHVRLVLIQFRHRVSELTFPDLVNQTSECGSEVEERRLPVRGP